MNNLEKMLLFLHLIVYFMRPAEAVNPSAGVKNCLRFQSVVPVPAFPELLTMSFEDTILSADNVRGLMGGRREDCDPTRGLDAVMRAIDLNDISKKVFKACIGTDKQYQISFDHADQQSFGMVFDNLHTLHIAPHFTEQHFVHLTIYHETLHVFLKLVRERLSTTKKPLLTVPQMFPNLDETLKNGLKYLRKIGEGLTYEFDYSMSSQESKVINNISDQLDQHQTKFPMFFERSNPIYKKILNKKSIYLEDIFETHGSSRYPFKKQEAFISDVDYESNGVKVYVAFENKFNTLLYAFLSMFPSIEYTYPENVQDEEKVVAIFQFFPPDLIKLVFPGLAEQLEKYADTLLAQSTLEPVLGPRGEDYTYYYEYASRAMLLQTHSTSFSIRGLFRASIEVVKHEDKTNAARLITMMNEKLISDPSITPEERLYSRMHLAKLYYLQGDKVKASHHFKYLEKHQSSSLFDQNVFGHKLYDNYLDCQQDNGASKISSSVKRKANNIV